MRRYLLVVTFILMWVTACSADTSEESASTQVITEEAHDEDHNTDEHEEEHGHGEEEHEHDEDEDHGHDEDHEHGAEDHEHDEDQKREHGAHEHGVAELFIAWSGGEMAIDLRTPAYNVVGFEYVPTTDAEIALLEESIAVLEEGTLSLIHI